MFSGQAGYTPNGTPLLGPDQISFINAMYESSKKEPDEEKDKEETT
jgi:hypothetical protein